jgi:adenosylhomocysteine nucleosidase
VELRGVIDPAAPLLVVAVHEEAEHLATELPVLVIGVGKVAATSTLLEVLAPLDHARRPSALINVGTAGALRGGLDGTHVIGAVFQHDVDSAAIEALIGEDPAPWLDLGEGPTLATGDQFVADRATRDLLGERADLVDMEGYAVAHVGYRLEMPVTLLKHVSDEADEGAVRSWIDSVAACSKELSRRLAEGLPPPRRPTITQGA